MFSQSSRYDDDGHPSVRLHPHVDAVCIGVFKIEILTPSLNGDRDSIEREREIVLREIIEHRD